MQLTSPNFENGDAIPDRYTCSGQNFSPTLQWRDLPEHTRSLALICVDPDAPRGTFTHWLLWNIDPALGEIDEGAIPRGTRSGRNDFGDQAYGGPCPPRGHGPHRYQFQLVALREPIDLPGGADRAQVEAAIADLVLDRAELVGVYERA